MIGDRECTYSVVVHILEEVGIGMQQWLSFLLMVFLAQHQLSKLLYARVGGVSERDVVRYLNLFNDFVIFFRRVHEKREKGILRIFGSDQVGCKNNFEFA
jgi:hypothetical protein